MLSALSVLLLASLAFAQSSSSGTSGSGIVTTSAPSGTCGEVPAVDVFSTANATSCSHVQTCQHQLCFCTCVDNAGASCSSGSDSGTYPTCLTNANNLNCTGATTCVQAYFQCLIDISSSRTNTSDTTCAAFGSRVYQAQLDAGTAQSLNGTALNVSCAYEACRLGNLYGVATQCSNLTELVCTAALLRPLVTSTTTSTAPGIAPAGTGPAAGVSVLWTAATVVALVMLS